VATIPPTILDAYATIAMRECEQRKAYNRIVAQRHGLYWQSDADRFTGAKFVEERTKARKK